MESITTQRHDFFLDRLSLGQRDQIDAIAGRRLTFSHSPESIAQNLLRSFNGHLGTRGRILVSPGDLK